MIQHNPSFTSEIIDAPSLRSIFAIEQLNQTNTRLTNSFWARFFRTRFVKLFQEIQHGCLLIEDPLGKFEFGNKDSDLRCKVAIKDINTYQHLALAGSNGSAEAYIKGLWSCDNPANLVRVLLRNQQQLDSIENGLVKLSQFAYQIWHGFNRNSKSGSRKNISAHYDLGNDFFNLFLDKRMMYSSALYQQNDDLQSASDRKLQRICDTLKLTTEDKVVEIGSGWGGFACYAAAKTGCHVTTITISKEQFEEAQNRVSRENLNDLVTVKLIDYRDLDGEYDKLVSIEMIEAVGHQYLDTYFDKISQLLKPNGEALIQAIVIDDERYQRALKEVDYIKRYIFPGSFIPCYSVIEKTAINNSLKLNDLYDMGSSYAQTLRDWRQHFYNQQDKISKLGYNNEFKRMWEFYLCYCEGGFSEKTISVGQLLFSKEKNNE